MDSAANNKQVLHWGILGAGRIANTFASDIKYVNNAKLYG
ncbi:MAG: hypothetical protein ACI9PC_001503 [Porticoccaceae bacterium]|jgi:hypothetical protein